jgi:RHS repeat-associated protein
MTFLIGKECILIIMEPKIFIPPNNSRKGVAFKLVLFPFIGLSKSSRALRGNEHGSMIKMPHLNDMEWDFAERLSHITRGTTEAYYNYDGSGERVRKVVEKGGVTETRLYLGGFEIFRKKIGNNLELERETLHIMDDTRRIALVETLTTDNEAVVNNPTPIQRYQLSNNIESATLELDETASIISYEEYYPYGDTCYQAGRSISEVSQKRYRYTGKEKDEESGLYYHGARYYAAWLGRWTAADPAGLVDGVNLYMYCRGDPVNAIDPDGMQTEDGAGIIWDVPRNIITEQNFRDWFYQTKGDHIYGDITLESTEDGRRYFRYDSRNYKLMTVFDRLAEKINIIDAEHDHFFYSAERIGSNKE